MSNYNWAEYPQPRYGHAGLEVLQQDQTQLRNPQPPVQISAPPPYVPEKPPGIICGLPKKTLWILLAIAIAVILSGIGGGLAARFAGQHKQENRTQGPGRGSVQALSSTSRPPTITDPTQSTAPAILITTIQTILSQNLTIPASSPPSNPCATTSAFTTGLWWMGTQN
ncbi:hypothetical protein K469DRAFT_690420 [Zopfia rhizophila CBS 207.26]|uniref:Uncharacterized protein n=1 Tax=Zopfia rhizophila CBS 207.26 TaxID=1314779 RepID=A0A6A6DW29_9PEZI|nr:hypothetical protein K469DRAFT_690420 [Zopfia rhizophila CBS 207.26]